MKSLQIASAMIELGAGLASPELPFGSGVVPGRHAAGGTRRSDDGAHICGSALLTLGVACWLAHGDTQSRAARGLIAAMLLYDVAVAGLLTFAALGMELRGVALWPAVVLHGLLSVRCVACLRRSSFKLSLLESKS